jgi:hypothetical protein
VYWFGMARRLGVPTAPGTRGVPTIHADASRTDIVACRSCRWPCARRAAAPYTARPNDPTATKEFGKTTPKPAWRQPIPSPSHRIMNASERSLHQATFTPLLGRHPGYHLGDICRPDAGPHACISDDRGGRPGGARSRPWCRGGDYGIGIGRPTARIDHGPCAGGAGAHPATRAERARCACRASAADPSRPAA